MGNGLRIEVDMTPANSNHCRSISPMCNVPRIAAVHAKDLPMPPRTIFPKDIYPQIAAGILKAKANPHQSVFPNCNDSQTPVGSAADDTIPDC
ncbi:MAG: hypothetical protein J5858_12785 [Lentisphaeria bacterium]|nr:hypothetical protein [Lentisphaeria bacterium]